MSKFRLKIGRSIDAIFEQRGTGPVALIPIDINPDIDLPYVCSSSVWQVSNDGLILKVSDGYETVSPELSNVELVVANRFTPDPVLSRVVDRALRNKINGIAIHNGVILLRSHNGTMLSVRPEGVITAKWKTGEPISEFTSVTMTEFEETRLA